MISEIAEIDVVPGQEEQFEAGVASAAAHFKAATGCRHFRLDRSIEYPSRYRLFVVWDTVENHMVDFRNSPGFQKWRELVSPYFAAAPRVEHLQSVLNPF